MPKSERTKLLDEMTRVNYLIAEYERRIILTRHHITKLEEQLESKDIIVIDSDTKEKASTLKLIETISDDRDRIETYIANIGKLYVYLDNLREDLNKLDEKWDEVFA